jgi:hypothetical protein
VRVCACVCACVCGGVKWEEVLARMQMRVAVAMVREGKFAGQFSGGVGDRFTGLVTVSACVRACVCVSACVRVC